MTPQKPTSSEIKPATQLERFAELARALECDEDDAAFDAKLRKVAKHKPVPEKPE